MNNLITVGVDGASSNQAVRWAVDRAVAKHAPLEFVHALPDPAHSGGESDVARRAQGSRLLARQASFARARGVRDVRESLVDNAVAPALVGASERAGLLVIGRRERAALIRRRSVSVSRHLSRYSNCPVVVVPDTPRGAASRRIVLLLHGAAEDRPAVDFAFEQAATTGSDIEAIHAWQESDDSVVFTPLTDPGLLQRLWSSELLMAEELAGYQRVDPDVQVNRISAIGNPDRILTTAAEHADLVVLPARTPPDEMLRTAEAELVAVRHVPCPVVYAR